MHIIGCLTFVLLEDLPLRTQTLQNEEGLRHRLTLQPRLAATTTAISVITKNSVAPVAHHQKVEKAEASNRPTPNPTANTPRAPFPGDARMASYTQWRRSHTPGATKLGP